MMVDSMIWDGGNVSRTLLVVLAFFVLMGLIFLVLKAVAKLDRSDDLVFFGFTAALAAICLMLLFDLIFCGASETIGGAVGGAGSRLAIDAFHGEAYRISDRRKLQVFGWADAETARLLGFAAMIAVLVAFLCISAEACAARERGWTIWMKWTAKETDRLRELWEAGVSVAEIAEMLGRSEQSVVARSRYIGLPSRHAGPRPLQGPLVPVVRCRDCAHCVADDKGDPFCAARAGIRLSTDWSGYCHAGRPRCAPRAGLGADRNANGKVN